MFAAIRLYSFQSRLNPISVFSYRFCTKSESRLAQFEHKIVGLSRDETRMLRLANEWRFQHLDNPTVLGHKDLTKCGLTVAAILALNPFNQPKLKPYLKDGDSAKGSLDELIKDLKDKEDRLFVFGATSCVFTRVLGGAYPPETRWFTGHGFVIQKVVTNHSPSYQLFQSYIDKYTLANFLSRDRSEYTFENFKSLYLKLITPLYSFPHNKEVPWTRKDCLNLEKITKVKMDLEGFTPEKAIFFFPSRTVS